MKIGEIIELTQIESLAKIAKERLEFGKKKATEAMQKAGCYTKNGMKGWYFDGDPSVLEQSIYDFASSIRRKPKPSPKAYASIDESTNEIKVVASTSEQKTIAVKELAIAKQELAVSSESKAKATQIIATSE